MLHQFCQLLVALGRLFCPVLFGVCGLSPLFFLLPWRLGPLLGWVALSRRPRPHSFFAQGPRLLLVHLQRPASFAVATPSAAVAAENATGAPCLSVSAAGRGEVVPADTRVGASPPDGAREPRPAGCEEHASRTSGTTDEERRGRLPGQIGAPRAIRRFFCTIALQIRAEIRECVCFFAATWKITRYSSCMACMAHPRSRFILMISTFAFAIAGAVATGTRSAPAGKTLSRAGKVGT